MLNDLGAKAVPVSRGGEVDYEGVYRLRADFVLNATPVGMYPDMLSAPVEPGRIEGLQGVADVIYNPARTLLMQRAAEKGLTAVGGLSMLVHQAAASARRFLGAPVPEERVSDTLSWLARETRSIALVGMPGSGKSTVAREVARLLGRQVFDTDQMIEAVHGPIPEIFAREGEARFRELEAAAIREAALARGAVIATGGGAVLRAENRALLRANCFVVQLERPLSELSTGGRPLSTGLPALERMHAARAPLYAAARDIGLTLERCPSQTAGEVVKRFREEVRV